MQPNMSVISPLIYNIYLIKIVLSARALLYVFFTTISFDLHHKPMKWVLLLVSLYHSLFKMKKLGREKEVKYLS